MTMTDPINRLSEEMRQGFDSVRSEVRAQNDEIKQILLGDGKGLQGAIPRIANLEHKVGGMTQTYNNLSATIKDAVESHVGPVILDVRSLKEDTRVLQAETAPIIAAHKSKRKIIWEITKAVIPAVIGIGATVIWNKATDPPPKQPIQKNQGP